jgi:hypothetical protein
MLSALFAEKRKERTDPREDFFFSLYEKE